MSATEWWMFVTAHWTRAEIEALKAAATAPVEEQS